MTAEMRAAARVPPSTTPDERRAAFVRSAAILALDGLPTPAGWDDVRAEVIAGTRSIGEAIVAVTGERRGLPDLPHPRAVGLDRYVDPVTKVPYNRLGLRRRSEIVAADYKMTDIRLVQLLLDPVRGLYDLDHLERMHRHIYADLYDWAGEFRDINFSRTLNGEPGWKARFAPLEEIPAVAASVRQDLGIWNTLNGLSHADFIARLTSIYVKLNYMHPFLKGNGRAIAALLTQLALEARYALRFELVEPQAWSRATAYSMPRVGNTPDAPKLTRDLTLIRDVFVRIAQPLGGLDR